MIVTLGALQLHAQEQAGHVVGYFVHGRVGDDRQQLRAPVRLLTHHDDVAGGEVHGVSADTDLAPIEAVLGMPNHRFTNPRLILMASSTLRMVTVSTIPSRFIRRLRSTVRI